MFTLFQSFQLHPTSTPGTYYLQTTSSQGLPLSLSTSQGLPLSLTNNSTVTLTSSSPSSHEHILLHSLSVRDFTLFPQRCPLQHIQRLLTIFHSSCILQTDGLCSSDGVIIHTVTSDPTSSDPVSQSQLVVETEDSRQDDRLDATSLLESSESVVTEGQEPVIDSFTDKV